MPPRQKWTLWIAHPKRMPVPMPATGGTLTDCRAEQRMYKRLEYRTAIEPQRTAPKGLRDEMWELVRETPALIKGWEAAARIAGWPIPQYCLGDEDYTLRSTDRLHINVIYGGWRRLGYLYMRPNGSYDAVWGGFLLPGAELGRGLHRDAAVDLIKQAHQREISKAIADR